MATPTAADKKFELDTGILCLDFANTWEDRGQPETDKLRNIGDLLAFAVQSGIADQRLIARLNDLRSSRTPETEEALANCLAVRERIYRIASAHATRRTPSPEDLRYINEDLGDAYARQQLTRTGEGYRWEWPRPEVGLTPILHPILRSFGELLASPELERVRECGGPTCTWLFLDRSHNGSRRWCSMKACGNRAKARRHYRRHKSSGSSA